tara:strand:- start:19102 stop:19713 length:612 start_codon:yes stop_codon:yes gene_type:complete
MARNAYIETPSIVMAVELEDAKSHLRVVQNDDDEYIQTLCFAAQQTVEKYCNILLLRTTVIQRGDTFGDIGELYFSPVENSGEGTLTHIKYYDADDVLQTWAATNYNFDNFSCPMRIGLAPISGADIPGIARKLNAVEVKYEVGYSTAAEIPKALKQAILILVGQWYENRQVAVVGRSVGVIPMTAQYLMDKYRIRTLGYPTC